MNSLNGKIALVTGGSRGLGKKISLSLANAGATVCVNYANNQQAAVETIEMIRSNGGKAMMVKADITSEIDVKKMIEEIQETCGGSVDIVVNNATGPQPELSIEESTWEDYLDQLHFFVKAPLLITKEVLPSMKEKGSGRIILIGSEVIQIGNPNFANYVSAKSAQLGLTRSYANELGPHGITVNLVNPGFIPVERHNHLDQEVIDGYRNQVPLRKMGEPEDIGHTVAFIASEEARYITGQSISVNGGNTFGV
ncbi:SDR family oxidoreductase [Bacillus weihaiensis]|uniref:3-oxoacyl-ACP reductase n=1 Tax=Bacillus weihaiensis TaxID=1547283 RepID=A0A1L3MRR9_9BACI|nr:SDR family oxidoreductase [Bacillus weihaiensis]APH05041.1 3-oxoacyl-ACP reductase [Bacillus weihaiensis]